MSHSDLAAQYVTAASNRNWDAFAALLSPDVDYFVPQTRERIQGRENYLSFNQKFPGGWRIELVRAVSTETLSCMEVDFIDGDSVDRGVVWLEHPQGVITRITDYWPEPYTPPAYRRDWPEITRED